MKIFYRISIYIVGLAVLSLGSVLNTKTGYGVAPINSVPYALSQLTGISLGGMTTLVFMTYIVIQMIMMGRRIRKTVLLQLPISILFGQFTNIFNQSINLNPSQHWVRLALLATAILITSVGVILVLAMSFEPLAPDGLTKEIGYRIKRDFGVAKNLMDVLSISAAVGIALILTGETIGVGVGTIISTIFIGRCITWLAPMIRRPLSRLMVQES